MSGVVVNNVASLVNLQTNRVNTMGHGANLLLQLDRVVLHEWGLTGEMNAICENCIKKKNHHDVLFLLITVWQRKAKSIGIYSKRRWSEYCFSYIFYFCSFCCLRHYAGLLKCQMYVLWKSYIKCFYSHLRFTKYLGLSRAELIPPVCYRDI